MNTKSKTPLAAVRYAVKLMLAQRLKATGFDIAHRQDMIVATKGGDASRRCFNVRVKSSASYHHLSQRHEFGMALRDFNRYKMLEKTGEVVYSVICERSTDTVYIAPLRQLAKCARIYGGDKLHVGGTAFLPRDAYRELRQL